MRFTWGALALIVIDGYLQLSGLVQFAPLVWVALAVTLAASVAADLHRHRGPGEALRHEAAPSSPALSANH